MKFCEMLNSDQTSAGSELVSCCLSDSAVATGGSCSLNVFTDALLFPQDEEDDGDYVEEEEDDEEEEEEDGDGGLCFASHWKCPEGQ